MLHLKIRMLWDHFRAVHCLSFLLTGLVGQVPRCLQHALVLQCCSAARVLALASMTCACYWINIACCCFVATCRSLQSVSLLRRRLLDCCRGTGLLAAWLCRLRCPTDVWRSTRTLERCWYPRQPSWSRSWYNKTSTTLLSITAEGAHALLKKKACNCN